MSSRQRLLSSRTKTFLHFSVLTVIITSLLMFLHLGYLFYGVMNANKVYLKRMCRNVRQELSQQGLSLSGELPERFTRSLDATFRLSSEDLRLRCALIRNDGTAAYQNTPLTVVLTARHFGRPMAPRPVRDIRASQEDRAFFINGVVVRGKDFLDTMETWHVMERLTVDGGSIFIETDCHFEFFERLLEGCLLGFVLALCLVFVLNAVFRKNIFRPLSEMRSTLELIRKGCLDARIPGAGAHDELSVFIGQLNATFADLEDAFGELRRFSSDAAHELRTPLTIIRGNIEVCLAKVRTADEYQVTLSQVLEETVSLGRMVDMLLLMTRMECNACEKLRVDVARIACEAAQWAGMLAEEKGQSILTEIEAGVQAHAVPELLKLLFRNLLHNAVKYSPSRSEVEFSLKVVGGEIEISVRDHGQGIPVEDQPRLFERFFRGQNREAGGYGLGLALVKSIVDYHGGRLRVDSEAGKGAAFIVTLRSDGV